MRKRDEKLVGEKAAKTINFDRIVLEKIEERAKKEKTTASNLVNSVCKQTICSELEYYRSKAKYHYLKFQEYNYMKEQQEIKEKTK